MKTVRPKPLAAPADDLELTPEEDFVLSRIDGRLSVNDLVALTGLAEQRVEQIVTDLASRGAVALEAAESSGYLPADSGSVRDLGGPDSGSTATLADFAAALGMDPSAFAAEPPAPAIEQPVVESRVESRSNYPPPAVPEADGADEGDADLARGPSASSPDVEGALLEEGAGEDALDEPAEAGESPEAQEAERAVAERNYRQLYEARWRTMTTDQRVEAARKAQGPDLYALCYDQEPRVVAALLENHTIGLDHVRMLAFHHRTTTGLELVTRRSDWVRDMLVERRLLRNPMIGDTVLGRIMASKRVLQTYKICIDRDIPDLTRSRSRGHLRTKWQSAPPEDRSELILRTEGRCLILMTGCTFDARTTQILCGKPYNSVLFIQNLGRFPATPPALLAHLIKQPFVRKNAPLKKLLLQHPNMPGEVKRQI